MKFLLVGTAFTPGAQALIVKGLPQYAPVILRAEPTNPYDALAVRVLVPRDSVIESPELHEALAAFALTLDSMEFPFHLGHLGAKSETKAAKAALREGHSFALCAQWHSLDEAARSAGRLIQHPNGSNLVEVTLA
jgi:hypothetical protein